MRLAFLAPLFAAFSFFHHGPTYNEMVTRAQSSVVRIMGVSDEGTQYVCTGFVIGLNRVLTASHCVSDAMIADGQGVNLLKRDPALDLAVLNILTVKPVLRLRDSQPERFESVTPMGYAFGWTTIYADPSHVVLMDISPNEDMAPGLILDSPCIHGQSGGPMIDDNGQVIGVILATSKNTCYGVGTALVRAFLVGVK